MASRPSVCAGAWRGGHSERFGAYVAAVGLLARVCAQVLGLVALHPECRWQPYGWQTAGDALVISPRGQLMYALLVSQLATCCLPHQGHLAK